MNIHAEKGKPRRAGLFIGLYFLGAGIFFILSNLHSYHLFGVAIGIVFFLCAPGFVVALRKAELEATGRLWIYRVAAVPVWCALPLLLVTGAYLWLNIGSHVTASRMIQHPLLYNNRLMHTSGYILAGGGKCTLLVQGNSRSTSKEVWLSSGSKPCTAATTTRIHAKISGTFMVWRSEDDSTLNYVLAGAKITPSSAGFSRSGN